MFCNGVLHTLSVPDNSLSWSPASGQHAQHACVNGVNLNHYLIVSQAANLDEGTNRVPFYLNGLTLILRWIILHYTMPE